MNQQELANLIKRYKSGSATPEEIAELEKKWLNATNNPSFEETHSEDELLEIEQNMFAAIKQEIGKHERQRRPVIVMQPVFYKAAAAVLVLLTVSIWWFTRSNSFTEIRTGFGERLTVTLPDHSSVLLNGNSVLRYSDEWNSETPREVWIEGEGFFSVTHTKDHQKFIVHADQLDVEVLGTKFNVRTRDDASEVMLAEGKVKLGLSESEDAGEMFLKPGELATLRDKQLSKRMVKQQQYTSWTENKLFFEHTPLTEVATLLEETYGLNVIFIDTDLQKRELSGEISFATADDILYAIAETFNLKVDKKGRSVTISTKNN